MQVYERFTPCMQETNCIKTSELRLSKERFMLVRHIVTVYMKTRNLAQFMKTVLLV